jgi:hypothetical protein
VIASDDHCPPHVHARHKEEGWIVRLWFSFVSPAVGVMTIAPSEKAVLLWQLNQMLDEISSNIDLFRQIWRQGKQTTCLENKWMALVGGVQLALLDNGKHGAKQVHTATYDVQARTTSLRFFDRSQAIIQEDSGE